MNLDVALTKIIETEFKFLPEEEKATRLESMKNEQEIKELPKSSSSSLLKGIYKMAPSVLVSAAIGAAIVTQFAVNPFAAFLIPFAGMEAMKRVRAYSARKALEAYSSSSGGKDENEAYHQAGIKAEQHWNDYIMAPWYSYLPTFACKKSLAFQAGREDERNFEETAG